MARRVWLALVLVGLFVVPAAFAADVSTVATDSRYGLNDPGKFPQGIMSIPKNEIRRIPDMIDNPKSQIGMWIPMMEPEPVLRGFDNRIQNNVEVYKNTGAEADKYPYIIKDKASGKFYVYKNVKYNWVFEAAGDKEVSGGKDGASGGEVWTPFFKASGNEKALEYARNIVNGNGDPTWDPKVYPNAHTKPFDSGISGTEDTKGSTVLQEVGMLLTYERGDATVTGATVAGYNGNADISIIDPNSIPEAKLVSTSNWESKSLDKIDGEAEGIKLKNHTGGTKFSHVNRVYVEDYKSPTLKDTKVKIYRGVTGQWVQEQWDPTAQKWAKAKGIFFEYEDDNADAAKSSDRLTASLNYECGNMDVYKLDNPYYNPDDPGAEAYIYFVYLPPTYKMNWNEGKSEWERIKLTDNPVTYDETVEFGPYLGPAKKGEEYSYMKNVDPQWSKKNPAEIEEYIKNKYANAYECKNMRPEYRGLAYFILDERNGGLLKIKLLNGYINKAKNTKNQSFEQAIPELADMIKEYASLGDKGKKAAADLQAFANYMSATKPGDVNRFSYIEFKDGGRYCVGPIEFEKDNPNVHSEEVVTNSDGSTMKKGSWMVPGPRVLLPKHFALNSYSWDSTGSNQALNSNQTDQSAKGFVLNPQGKWVRNGSDATAGVPGELAVAGQSSSFIKKYGDNWMQQVPDCMFKVDMADCCGNTTNQVGFLKVLDSGEGTKPTCECTISDSGTDTTVGVPPSEAIENGGKVVILDPKTGEKTECAGGEYTTCDVADKVVTIQKGDAVLAGPIGGELLSGKNTVTQGPDGMVLQMADKVINEDSRLAIHAVAKDNIDAFEKNRGISAYKLQIQKLTAEGQPTGEYELLEDETGNKETKIERSAFDSKYNGKVEEFNPDLKFYHIFRAPGLYRVEYTVRDVPTTSLGDENEQKLWFRVLVRDVKTDTRTIKDDVKRQ